MEITDTDDKATVFNRYLTARLRISFPVVAMVLVFLALIVGYASLQSGSGSLVLTYLGGERLLVEPPNIFLGEQEPRAVAEATFRVVNSTGQEVNVLGAEPTCSCVTLDELPISIPAGQSRALRLKVHVGRAPHQIDETVRFFTDYEDSREFVVTIGGHVRDSETH